MRKIPALVERKETVRQAIHRELEFGAVSALDISKRVSIPEKEVAHHLEHIAKSVKHAGNKLEIQPAYCLNCKFVFKERSRFTKPSACPKCRNSRIEPPRFMVSVFSKSS